MGIWRAQIRKILFLAYLAILSKGHCKIQQKSFFRNNMIAGCIISQSWSQCGLSVKLSCLPALPCTCPRSYLDNQVIHLQKTKRQKDKKTKRQKVKRQKD